jgi:amidohydrolase
MENATILLDKARQLQHEIIGLRRHIHQYPELGFQEHNTAQLAADRLKELGFQVRSGVGKTGVVADLGSGKDGKHEHNRTIAIRADMDALPINEAASPYRSKHDGIMHACGHDAHVACALGAAKIISNLDFPGRVRMLMQPSEEDVDEQGRQGAFRMIEDGAMDGVSAVIGLHMMPAIPAGKVGLMPGPIMAAADGFEITIHGLGGHGSTPEKTVDAVVIATQVVHAIQQIVSRRISAMEPAVITIGSFQSSSTRGNIISDSVRLLGTIRSFDEQLRVRLREEVERACGIARLFGGDYSLTFDLGCPCTVNDRRITAVMHQAACDLIGAKNVITFPPVLGCEDFSMLAEAAPGAFMFLGSESSQNNRYLHTHDFDIDESVLPVGTAILVETAKRLLSLPEEEKEEEPAFSERTRSLTAFQSL